MPILLRLPRALPHPLVGRFVRILHALYGLLESSRFFSLEITRILMRAGFASATSELQLFSRFASGYSSLHCYACVTVDDVLIISNSAPMRDSLYAALTARYRPLSFNLESSVHTGIGIHRLPLGAVLLTQDNAIGRAASLVGVSQRPPVSLPYNSQFFAPMLGDEVAPIDPTVCASLTGTLVQFLKIRHDVRVFVLYLRSFNNSPSEGHFRRAIHNLRYFASSAGIGCRYASVGVAFIVFTDSAFALLCSHGLSSTANMFCLGRYAAPFAAMARFQTGCCYLSYDCGVLCCWFCVKSYSVFSSVLC